MRLRPLLTFMAGLLVACFPAWGDALIVNNSSFENLPTGGLNVKDASGAYELGAVPGWNALGSAVGEMQPIVGSWFNSLPDGPTVAFVANGNVLYQDIGVAMANTTYTLSVDVGARNDVAFGGSVMLSVNGVQYEAVGGAPTAGNWSTYTFTYTTLKPDVGAQIYIDLMAARNVEAAFDDVQLTAMSDSGVPEPGTAALSGLFLAGIAIYKRRIARRRSNARAGRL